MLMAIFAIRGHVDEDNAFHQFIVTLTAEAGESPAALVQAYFLAEAWVSESQSAYS